MKELLEKRADMVANMKAILDTAKTENRDLTAEEITSFDKLEGDHAAVSATIERAQKLEAAQREQQQVIPAAGRGNLQRDIVRAGGPEPRKEFESLAEFMYCVTYRRQDPRLAVLWQDFDQPEKGAAVDLRMDVGPSGGFLVPKEIRTTVLQIRPQEAIVRPRATVIGTGSQPDAAVGMPALDQTGATQPTSNFGGVTGSWIAEGATKPQADVILREIELVPKEWAGHIVITDKLLRNWQGARAFLDSLFRNAMIAAEDTAFISGTGVNQPLGILNSSALYSESRAGAGAIATDDIQQMVARFMRRGGTLDSAVWSVSQSTLPSLFSLKGGNNENIWMANIAPDYPGTLFGIPVMINNRQPALGTKGDVILADWSYYLIKDGSGPFVDASPHFYFTSNKTVIKFFFLVDGAPWLSSTFKEENGWEVSPFVTLAT